MNIASLVPSNESGATSLLPNPVSRICVISGLLSRALQSIHLSRRTGVGNREFNERNKDWEGYDYAYEIKSVYELKRTIGLVWLGWKYEWGGLPRGGEVCYKGDDGACFAGRGY